MTGFVKAPIKIIREWQRRRRRKRDLLRQLDSLSSYVIHLSADNPHVADLHERVCRELKDLSSGWWKLFI